MLSSTADHKKIKVNKGTNKGDNHKQYHFTYPSVLIQEYHMLCSLNGRSPLCPHHVVML